MKEDAVVQAFCAYLHAQGWETTLPSGREFTDVIATRGSERMYAEAKGTTGSIGTDVDTMFGQLLRRMHAERARYAVVVPQGKVLADTLRVPESVLDRLHIEVYAVAPDGTVTLEYPSRSKPAPVGT